jgi:hypothetical protein
MRDGNPEKYKSPLGIGLADSGGFILYTVKVGSAGNILFMCRMGPPEYLKYLLRLMVSIRRIIRIFLHTISFSSADLFTIFSA